MQYLEIKGYIDLFASKINYVPFNQSYSKYLLARIYKNKHPDMLFESFYFQRKQDSFVLYQFLTHDDVTPEINKLPKGLKELFVNNLCSYCIVPKQLTSDLNKKPFHERVTYLLKHDYLLEFNSVKQFDLNNLQNFFVSRNEKIKELIFNLWHI